MAQGPVILRLPRGSFDLCRGICLGDGQHLLGERDTDGRPGTHLRADYPSLEPLIRIRGSAVTVDSMALTVPTRGAGEHDGDIGTAITVGRYLYSDDASWITDVSLRNLSIDRGDSSRSTDGFLANTIAVMGAVAHTSIHDVDISGGGTGLAVHWGAQARSVYDIQGPSYHPHHLLVRGLRVANAFEGFYLSSVHDVGISQVDLDEVDIGFRLLPGDNTARFVPAESPKPVSTRIEVSDCRVSWLGDLYAVRAAGWGQSPVDGLVTRLPFESAAIRRCFISAKGNGRSRTHRRPHRRAAIVLEQASGLALEDITFEAGPNMDLVRTDGSGPGHLSSFTVG